MSHIDDELWDEFHRVVNMTSHELRDWLRAAAADEETETLPDQSGPELGRRVVKILAKRRVDLTTDDASVMQRVVELVHSERRSDLEPTAGQDVWRHRLMSLGHDPLKPA